MRRAIAALALAFAGAVDATAASAVLGGVRLSCPAAKAVYILPYLPQIAQADVRRRIIYLGARELAGASAQDLRFVVAHECGHLAGGHDEHAADAYAANLAGAPSARVCGVTQRCGALAPTTGRGQRITINSRR
jgi:hypothetical protein